MKHLPEFVAFVDDAGVFAFDDPKAVKAHYRQFKGHEVVVTIEKRERSISHRQRKWLRGPFLDQVVAHLIEHCGYEPNEIDREQLHYDFLALRFGTKAVAPVVPGAAPRIVLDRTSSDLSVHDTSEYMEWVVRYCAEKMDCPILLPDECLAPREAVTA